MGQQHQPPNRIRELREAQHLSLRDLAERATIDHSTIGRMERGDQPLDYPRGKKIAAALGVRLSGLLLDEDVELRATPAGNAVLAQLADVPEDAWPQMVEMARQLVGITRSMAARHTAGALHGSPRQISELADIWGHFDETGRDRALHMLRLVTP